MSDRLKREVKIKVEDAVDSVMDGKLGRINAENRQWLRNEMRTEVRANK